MEADKSQDRDNQRVDVEGVQKDMAHRLSHGNVVLINWANLPKGLATNPGQALDCGQLIPTNLLMYPQDKTPLLGQEQFIDFHRYILSMGHIHSSWMFCRDCKVAVPSLDLVHITSWRKKQLRKHHRHKKLADCFKYIIFTISYKGGYFSLYRLWNRDAEGPSVSTKNGRAKIGSEVALLISSPLPRQPEGTSLNTDIVNAAEGWDDTMWKGFSLICIIINTCISGIN